MKKYCQMPVITVAVLLLAGLSQADEADWVESDILDQRLVMEIPQGAVIETDERQSDTNDSVQKQDTRIVYESGDQQLTVSVSEMFVFAGDEFSSTMRNLLSGWAQSEGTSMNFIPLADHNHLVMGLLESPNTDDDQILIAAAFVRHFDNTVVRLSVDINPAMHTELARAQEMSYEMLLSARPAREGLELSPGERFISLPGGQLKFVVDLPENHVITAEHGPDYSVYRVIRVTGIMESSPSLGIYIGRHPALHYKSIPESALKLGTIDARLFDRKQQWVRYTVNGQPGVQLETIATVPGLEGDWRIHFFGSAPDDSSLFELLDTVTTARIEALETE